MALTQVSSGMLDTTAQYYSFKNRIINGAMMIDQRNAGASSSPVGDGYFIDRYRTVFTGASKFTVGQNLNSITPLSSGFVNYAGLQVATAGSVAAGDINAFAQFIEGTNVSDLGWGTANAQTVTLSFWVRSNITGTFGGALQNSAQNRSYPFTYAISSANTWEQKTVTIAGDTTGTWLTTTGIGIRVAWSLGTGSTYSGTAGAWAGANYWSATGATSIMGSTSNVFYITGVQLEKGSTATSFDYRPYGTELALCQRYCYVMQTDASNLTTLGYGIYYTTNTISINIPLPVTMRASPSYTAVGTTNPRGTTSTGTNISLTAFAPRASSYGSFLIVEATGTTTTQGVYSFGGFGGGSVVLSAEL